ncbi:site-specific integrase [Sebaldella sp. S0638]|uniref:tyrosine-type recombinase/integrase n=1 Tax=Sebaldella sp. S0638 TaxID=2957809 RepID=UPI00209EB573|nr:site-specific integrase [Sebaldella sp. S0638]MCP1226590.1 site-specific integrase [Sebaldella sp. S0638]
MAGYVRKRGKTWEYSFELGKVNGKRQRESQAGFSTKKEAEKALREALTGFESGTITNTDNISFHDFLNLYYKEYVCIHNKYNTQVSFKATSKKLKEYLGKYKLSNITPALCQNFINELYREGKSSSTIKLQLTYLRMVLNYAMQPLNLIKSNPAQKLKIPKFEKDKKIKTISLEEFDIIMNSIKPWLIKYRMALLIGLHTGMRESEIMGLTWDKVDFKEKTICVDRKLININNKKVFETPKSKSSVRVIKIGETLINILKAEKERQEQLKKDYFEFYNKIDFVCCNDLGVPMSQSSLTWQCRKLKERTGIDFNFHLLRHTHATMLIEAGANPVEVSKRLGHSNTSITLNIYSHSTSKMEQDTVNIFENTIKEQP